MAKERTKPWDAAIVGGGIGGLSAAIYLARAERDVLVIDDGRSMARWEPDVQNYLGFPDGVSGHELLSRGREQAENYSAEFAEDTVVELRHGPANVLFVVGKTGIYEARRVLLATGIFHLPPDIPGVKDCLGHSMFFCKDCDGFRNRGKRIGIFGGNNEAVDYALGMIVYSPCVALFLNGRKPGWDAEHEQWIKEYEIPVYANEIIDVHHTAGCVQWLEFAGGVHVQVDALFTTRGDVYHNQLARQLGAETDTDGEIIVDGRMQTSIPGVYAAGCVTPANCQMIIAAGQGATAAQAINRSLFEESLVTHSLHRFRARQLETEQTHPDIEVA